MAALAGSTEVIEKWGRDRPLGLIAQEVYRPEVRDHIPDHGPLVVFTSGLFPGHHAQYNRVISGTQRWKKIGSTSGYGSFHISFETTEAMRRLNETGGGIPARNAAIWRGIRTRFRSVGRALGYLGLPDLRKHETKRPIYALPIVRNPQATILEIGRSLIVIHFRPLRNWLTPGGIAGLRHQLLKLVNQARESPNLESALYGILRSSQFEEP